MLKISVKQLRGLISESLLAESACPNCGNMNAYHGFTKVECPNPECMHYTKSVDNDEEDLEDLDDEAYKGSMCDACGSRPASGNYDGDFLCDDCSDINPEELVMCPDCQGLGKDENNLDCFLCDGEGEVNPNDY